MNEAVTVTQLNRYVASILEADKNLSGIFVKGEISSLKKYSSGHLYFNLKDDKACVSCVMFYNLAKDLTFVPNDGQKVIINAKASLYDRDGKFQLYVNSMKKEGLGDLFLAFEELKQKLNQQGFFDVKYKQKIPFLPNRIGVVTSPSGAVIKDIINVLSRRFYNFNLLLVPSVVQGSLAPQSIVNAIEELNNRDDIDVIIVARGGGSIEDLWCFNDEMVARAVFASKIPIISAVGHETDFTICDFVADLRAPTPSAAAELVMPIRSECENKIKNFQSLLVNKLVNKLEYSKLKLKNLKQNKMFSNPDNLYNYKREIIDSLEHDMDDAFNRYIENKKKYMSHTIQRLDGLSPLKVLSRGYSVTEKICDNTVVKSVFDINESEMLKIRLIDGSCECRATKISRN